MSTIVLLGPMGAGKSTVGRLLADELGQPFVDLDGLRGEYYSAMGYDKERAKAIHGQGGMTALIQYWKPFEVGSVERVVVDHAGSVIAFGAGQSVHDVPEHATRVAAALRAVPLVVCLLPSLDPTVSIAVLRDRNRELPAEGHVTNEAFVRHPANRALATHVVTTEGKDAAAVAVEVARLVRSQR
jgi:shikimate kinase